MTEPPEPRRPEEGGGEELPDGGVPFGDDDPIDWEQWDDDVLLDQIGSGQAADEFDDVGELRDMLESWRDDVDSEPVPPIAERAQEIHDFNEAVDRATRPPDTGGTNPMSQLSDLANAVGSHVDMQEVLAALAQAEQVLSAKREAVMGLLADTAHAGAVEGAFAAASEAVANALGPVNAVGEAIGGAASAIRGGGS